MSARLPLPLRPTLPRTLRLVSSALALTLLAPALAAAYSLENHAALTRQAVELVKRCRKQGLQTPDPSAHASILVDYNLGQDKYRYKAPLWHFPSDVQGGEKGCPSNFLVCWLSYFKAYDPWVRELWHRVEHKVPAATLYPALGSALHYVQDLAVPAHAVPVFHPAPIYKGDGFDDYEGWRRYGAMPATAELAKVCAELARADSLQGLMHRMRTETLDSLRQEFVASVGGAKQRLEWGLFWREDLRNGADGRFGSYGCDDDFGEREVRCGEQELVIADDEYQRYAARRAQAAVRFSAATIVVFQRQLGPCSGATCTPQSELSEWYPAPERLERIPESRRHPLDPRPQLRGRWTASLKD